MKQTNRKTLKKVFTLYAVFILCLTVFATTAFAADDPIQVVNNLSSFMFGLIRAVGMILLGSGILQALLACPRRRRCVFCQITGSYRIWKDH